MARGSKVIVSSEPRGRFQGCIISGTPIPGTLMELVPDTPDQQGVFTYRARTGVDGGKGPICVLMEDDLQGKIITDAYVSGTYGRMYWPAAGEELNLPLRYQPGTGTSLNSDPGDLLEVDGATGYLQGVGTGGATGSHASAPFQLMENLGVAPTQTQHVHVQFLGQNA